MTKKSNKVFLSTHIIHLFVMCMHTFSTSHEINTRYFRHI